MAEVRWTQQAADDLESITDFISQDSPHYARLFATDVIAAVERLSSSRTWVERYRRRTTLLFVKLF